MFDITYSIWYNNDLLRSKPGPQNNIISSSFRNSNNFITKRHKQFGNPIKMYISKRSKPIQRMLSYYNPNPKYPRIKYKL